MAIACLRLLTFPPLPPLPLFSVSFFRRLIALLTSLEALREYLRAIRISIDCCNFPIKRQSNASTVLRFQISLGLSAETLSSGDRIALGRRLGSKYKIAL